MSDAAAGAPQLISPFLWFHDGAEEALRYYVDVFPDSEIEEIQRYPDESLDPHDAGMAGKVISAWVRLGGVRFGALDGGPAFTLSEAVSFVVACRDQEEIDRYWAALSHVPEAEQCGWCKDRFGVSWQIIPADMGRLLQSPAQIQAMMAMRKIEVATLEALA